MPITFQEALKGWFREHRRELPWRESPSLYKTVVSEFMLQQTQVVTVIPYFERWMARFPDFATLAAAEEEVVVKHWEGLGYYSRARNLHRLARAYVVATPKPETAAEWRTYPGVGAYTAAAIASLRFGEPIAVVDGNVVRVLTRLSRDATPYKDGGTAVEAMRSRAQTLLCVDEPGVYNEALMELGATVCTKRNPNCEACPVRGFCQAGQMGDAETFPCLQRRKAEHTCRALIWCEHENQLLLARGDKQAKRLANLWELPELSALADRVDARGLEQALLARRTRGIGNQRIEESLYRMSSTPRLLRWVEDSAQLQFIPFSSLETQTLSGPHKKWIQSLLCERERLCSQPTLFSGSEHSLRFFEQGEESPDTAGHDSA